MELYMFRYLFAFILTFSLTQDTLSGYLRETEMSFCMDDCSEYYIEAEIDSDFGHTFVVFDDYEVDISMYLNRFVEVMIGSEVDCIECSAFSILRMNLSQDCISPIDCVADPCEFLEDCQLNMPVDCVSSYCGGCYADFYDLDNNLVNCYNQDDEWEDDNDWDEQESDCEGLSQDECFEAEGCQWYENEGCYRSEGDEDEEGNGVPECLSDCNDISFVDPENDPYAACDWIISNFGPNNFFNDCAEDCSADTLEEINQIVEACYSCLEQDSIDCADLFENNEDNLECSDYDSEDECRMNDCEWLSTPTGLGECVNSEDFEPVCEDMSDLFFGWCEMVLGVGWNGQNCNWVSGCGAVAENGVDYSASFFDSIEDCESACANDHLETGYLYGVVEYVWGDAIEMVAGALVQVSSEIGFYTTETNDQGYYSIEVPQGQYSITVEAYNDYQTQNLYVSSNQDHELNFSLGEWYYPSVLMGRVLCENCDNQLAPIEEADILISNSIFSFQTFSDNQGYFFVDLPASGDYNVIISKEGYSDYAEFVSVQGYTEMNFYLNISNSGGEGYAMLSLENISTSPGSEAIQGLFLESDIDVGGLQFTVSPEELAQNILEADINSLNDCFSASSNYINGTFIGIIFSLEGCTFPSNEQIHIADLSYYISENTESGTSIFMDFESTLVSDAMGNEILSYGEGALISVGILGDVNFDAEINILDVISIVNFAIYINEPNDSEFWAADLNSDSMLDILDIVIIVNMILNN